jgi:hypothetical protein
MLSLFGFLSFLNNFIVWHHATFVCTFAPLECTLFFLNKSCDFFQEKNYRVSKFNFSLESNETMHLDMILTIGSISIVSV